MVERLRDKIRSYQHYPLDIRNREELLALVDQLRPDLIIHTAAQPSYDRAAAKSRLRPGDDMAVL